MFQISIEHSERKMILCERVGVIFTNNGITMKVKIKQQQKTVNKIKINSNEKSREKAIKYIQAFFYL